MSTCQELHTIHSGFHSDLAKACSNRHNTFTTTSNALTISDCFVKWKEKFLKYGEYCSNLPHVQTLLDKLEHNQSANQAIMVLFLMIVAIIFKPHRSTTYIGAACCYRQCSMVCLSVGRSVCHHRALCTNG